MQCMSDQFFDLIRVALNKGDSLQRCPTDEEWAAMLELSQNQAILGVIFHAFDKLTQNNQKPPLEVLFEWIGCTEQIMAQNKIANKRCIEVSRLFEKAGFKTCVLKGQGNALLYPEPLLRNSGDIDLWVNGETDAVIGFVKERYPNVSSKISSHHIDFPVFQEISVEVHYVPTYSLVRKFQSNLNQYIEDCKPRQFDNPVRLIGVDNTINVPTDDFNMVFQLSHMQRHFFGTGIGFRHIIDYYYLLKRVNTYVTISQKRELKEVLVALGMLKFASAVMWVLKEVLLMEENWMICEPDEKRGKLLLDEIMRTGNFGYGDQRKIKKLSNFSTTLAVMVRNMKMVRLFPGEALCAPITGVSRRFFH